VQHSSLSKKLKSLKLKNKQRFDFRGIPQFPTIARNLQSKIECLMSRSYFERDERFVSSSVEFRQPSPAIDRRGLPSPARRLKGFLHIEQKRAIALKRRELSH
jgi:hypothetical protein